MLSAAKSKRFDVLLVDDLSRLSRDSVKTKEARAAFATLSAEEQGALRVYLMSLKRVPRLMIP